MSNKILITGGSGFIGSALIRFLIRETDNVIINYDKLTYAGNPKAVAEVADSARYHFIHADICDRAAFNDALKAHTPTHIMHLAAESHVDRSIDGPGDFIHTNITGTYELLEASRAYYESLAEEQKSQFRFHHISTDEVYGDLGESGLFTEQTPYAPSSPYSASKAASDHLVRAWRRTFKLPVVITNCSNNYGPYQYPEKLIPLVILNALAGKPLPVYGDGSQIRDWLFVDDHARALYLVLLRGNVGETYNIGGFNEKKNLDVVKTICNTLNELVDDKPSGLTDFKELITFVTDRAGHDVRYAIDATKINHELGWQPRETFETGIRKTVMWYLDNRD